MRFPAKEWTQCLINANRTSWYQNELDCITMLAPRLEWLSSHLVRPRVRPATSQTKTNKVLAALVAPNNMSSKKHCFLFGKVRAMSKKTRQFAPVQLRLLKLTFLLVMVAGTMFIGRAQHMPSPGQAPTAPHVPGRDEPGGPGGPPAMPPMPKPGICPLPILPALPTYADASFFANADVPHGKVEEATYKSYSGKEKRMHVYLPPDYQTNASVTYPTLYLNHGGGGDDSNWTSTDVRGGSANFILDNLIAAGKAKPMVVVMPNTHECASATPSAPGKDDTCTQEYLKDIIPYAEHHYRVKADRADRAIAGLSMGGFVAMNTGLPHLDTFSALYVYSSGYFPDQQKAFEDNFQGLLKDPQTNDLFRVPFYMSAGETDIALKNGQAVMSVINKYGIRNFWVLSSGGHEMTNWRRDLYQTAQIMFPDCGGK